MIHISWSSFINFMESVQTRMALTSIASILSAITLLILVIFVLETEIQVSHQRHNPAEIAHRYVIPSEIATKP